MRRVSFLSLPIVLTVWTASAMAQGNPEAAKMKNPVASNAESIAAAALSRLARDGKFDAKKAKTAFTELGINTEKIDPQRA